MTKRIIAVDLDGTLAHYDGWKGITHIGRPIESVVAAMKEAKEDGAEIWIFTARVSSEGDGHHAAHYILDWLKMIDFVADGITATKHKFFTEFWDDRAIQVIRNTGEFVIHPEVYRDQADARMNAHQLQQEAEVVPLFTPADEPDEPADGDWNPIVFDAKMANSPRAEDISARDIQIGGNHYKKYKIQPYEFVFANKIPALEANAQKYILRHQDKNGIEDLRKARHYLELMAELYYGEKL